MNYARDSSLHPVLFCGGGGGSGLDPSLFGESRGGSGLDPALFGGSGVGSGLGPALFGGGGGVSGPGLRPAATFGGVEPALFGGGADSFLHSSLYGIGAVTGEGEAWGPFGGDFYREPDNVVRGVSLAPGSVAAGGGAFGGLGPPGCFGEGDLYGGAAEGPETLLCECLPDLLGPARKLGGALPGLLGGRFAEGGPGGRLLAGAAPARFEEADRPPKAPADPFFRLQTTTTYAVCDRPHELGNALLDFLGRGGALAAAAVTKVTREKFAIKADVFMGSTMCSLKIRVYGQREEDNYAVEFQPRSGDRMTFANAYQEASKFLGTRFVSPTSGPPVGGLLAAAAHAGLCSDDAGSAVLPLLDMANLVHMPALQAEAATALADLAQNVQVAAGLCTGPAFEAFKLLLQSTQTDVAYPTARLLLLLAQYPEAIPCFADGVVLPKLLDKVKSEATSSLVRRELAAVLNAAISRCAGALGNAASADLLSALGSAIQAVGAGDPPTCRNLQEARGVLQRQRPGASG